MPSIDGLATGIDTASIVESLLTIQQSQIDRFSVRRQNVVNQQSAFKGLEAKLLTLQGSAGRLTRVSDNALQQKSISASDETAVKAAVSDNAVEGVYRIRVASLARSHQIVSNAYATEDGEIAQGSYALQIGNGTSTPIVVDNTNNTLKGVMQSINNADLGVTASIIDDGSTGDSVHLLLTAKESGAANTISLSFTPVAGGQATEMTFDLETPVQAAANATVFLGSGDGAIQVVSESNQFDNLFAGITFEALKADPEKEIELNVVRDIESSKTAITDFVSSYNDVVSYIEEQARFDPATETATVLFGNRSVSSIRSSISQAVTSVVPGLDKAVNRLSAIGVDIGSDGKLSVNQSELTAALNGQVENVDIGDFLDLFGTRGKSNHQNIQFVLASDKTRASQVDNVDGEPRLVPYQVKVIQAAEKAHLTGAALASGIVIDETNNEFSIVVDNGQTATIELDAGTYEPQELADQLQLRLDSHENLANRPVVVSIADGALSITSSTYGQSSEITIQESSAIATLGFSGPDSSRGRDVIGHFITKDKNGNDVIESAEGRGQMLIGRAKGEGTSGDTEGLQVRVTLTPAQVTEDIVAEVTVTRGIASRLGQEIKKMTDPAGSLDRIENEFTTRIESIDESIARMNALFESKQQSLLAEFARLESSVSDLQSVGSLLGSQLASLPRFSV